MSILSETTQSSQDGDVRKPPDFSKERGITPETQALFNVRVNGTGWLWETRCLSGNPATRWKSFYSTREEAPENEQAHWTKYLWHPEKPADAKYFYPPKLILKTAVDQCDGVLFIVGGEVAAMSMFDAGYRNVISFFGDTNIPHSLVSDLRACGVTTVRMIPDRDESGLQCVINVRDDLKDSGITFTAFQLPYNLEAKHGKDVNDFWIMLGMDNVKFMDRLDLLNEWTLPKQQPIVIPQIDLSIYGDSELPEMFIADIERALNVYPYFNSEGWSKRNVLCPFHSEEHPSATWNHQKAILRCHAGCSKSYLAKEVGEFHGLRLSEYFREASTLELVKNLPTVQVDNPPPIVLSKTPERRFSPPLSDIAQLNTDQLAEAEKGRAWLDEYIKWAKDAGPLSPEIFYEALGLWTLSIAATRRMKVSIGGENIFPNLYVFIVATTTVYRKSTALHLANEIIEKSNLEFLKMPERATPEAMFEYLAGKTPTNFGDMTDTDQQHWAMGRTFAAQRAIMEDEASGLLSEMKKDYMSGLSELLLKGYDGQGILRKLLKSQGQITIREMCLSFLGATTPIEWGRRMTNEEKQNGFVARFAIITPENAPIYMDSIEDVPLPYRVINKIRNMFINVLPWDKSLIGQDGNPRALPKDESVVPPPITNVQLAPEAMAQISKYRKAVGFSMLKSVGGEVEEDKASSYARLGTMMIKVGMLLAAIEAESPVIRIEARHAYAAQQICERWRESLHRLDEHVNASRRTNIDDKVLAFIKAGGEVGVTARDIQRACNLETPVRENNIKLLLDAGAIEIFKRETKGRPAICYRVIADKVS